MCHAVRKHAGPGRVSEPRVQGATAPGTQSTGTGGDEARAPRSTNVLHSYRAKGAKTAAEQSHDQGRRSLVPSLPHSFTCSFVPPLISM